MSSPTPSEPQSTGAAALLTLRMLVASLLAVPIFLIVAMSFVLGTADDALALTGLLLAPLILGLAVHGVCEVVGYRMPATAPGTPRDSAEDQSREAFLAKTILRFALCESVMIVSMAAGFVVSEGGFAIFLVGAVVAEGLLWWHCWPDDRVLTRCQESLEREGGQSFLREAYGLPPSGGGAIKEL